jgi:hypothetical protein
LAEILLLSVLMIDWRPFTDAPAVEVRVETPARRAETMEWAWLSAET